MSFNRPHNDSFHSHSLWMDFPLPSFPPLSENLSVDVCIVGAGIAGLTCAYTLAEKGKSVAVIDQGMIGGGQTSRTTAHLSWILGDRYFNLEELFGKDELPMIAESHSNAIDYIEEIIKKENIQCDFERLPGFLFNAPETSEKDLDKEFAVIRKMNMPVDKVEHSPLNFTGPSLCFPNQGQFHIRKYLEGLVKAIVKKNGKIFSHTHAAGFEDGTPCHVKTENGHEIKADAVIVTTCSPINDRFYIHTKQAAYRTYVIVAKVPKNSVPRGLYWDTSDPYHYIRLHPNAADPTSEWLIIGGQDHKTGQDKNPSTNYKVLEKWAKKRFPLIGPIEYQWSGQVFESMDSLAFIGKNPENLNTYIATGDSGNGITHGTIAGILLPQLILENSHPWENLYNASRKTIKAAKEFIEENLNTLAQYRDWLTPDESNQIDSLKPEEGFILRKGLKKFAVYKDNQNNLYTCSAFCPHLGGCVRWNSSEKCWDCPCHGSQFDAYGNVMCGPSIDNLSKANLI